MELNQRFIVREVTVYETIRGKMRDIKTIMIGAIDDDTGIIYPHYILNHFIQTKYEFMGKSLNTSDGPARKVCRFLNYCLDRIKQEDENYLKLAEKGLSGLERIHASRFITSLTLDGLQHSTVKDYERYLTNFYVYLKEMKLIDESFEIHQVIPKKRNSNQPTRYYESIFQEPGIQPRLPSRQTTKKKPAKLKDFGSDKRILTNQFINIARDIESGIALGLCFQFYGGLRRGEVVNIGRGEIIVDYRQSMEVQIKDNRAKFFSRLKDTKAENPKRLNYLSTSMTRQTILDNDLVWAVYDEHMKRLEVLSKNKKIRNHQALFFDADGNPMSGKVYDYKFSKVKKAFLEKIMEHKDYELIEGTYWGSHIGRGVFTNLLIDMGFSITQLAIARGDRNINSAMAYIDETLTNKQIAEAINNLKNCPTEALGTIDFENVQQWKRKV